jgi:hypothetical protein
MPPDGSANLKACGKPRTPHEAELASRCAEDLILGSIFDQIWTCQGSAKDIRLTPRFRPCSSTQLSLVPRATEDYVSAHTHA